MFRSFFLFFRMQIGIWKDSIILSDRIINMHGMLAREFSKGTSNFALSKILFSSICLGSVMGRGGEDERNGSWHDDEDIELTPR